MAFRCSCSTSAALPDQEIPVSLREPHAILESYVPGGLCDLNDIGKHKIFISQRRQDIYARSHGNPADFEEAVDHRDYNIFYLSFQVVCYRG